MIQKFTYQLDKMQRILNIIEDYFKRNKLKLNTSKTKYMIVKSKNKTIDLRNIVLQIDGENIECVHNIKYLGIIIDDQLKFDIHTDYICKKSSAKVGLLNRIKHKINLENRICIYKTIVAPHFEYCSTILFLLNETQTKRLQKIQNKAMRAVMIVNKRTSIKLMLDTLNWMSIKRRITMRTLQFIHNFCTNDDAPSYLKELITRNHENHNYNLRNKNNLNIKRCKKVDSQNSLDFKRFNLYNSIPERIKKRKIK